MYYLSFKYKYKYLKLSTTVFEHITGKLHDIYYAIQFTTVGTYIKE